MKLPNRNLSWPISWEGVVEIAESEGCRLEAYPDPVSKGEPFTIGYGQTFRADGRKVTRGMRMTQDEADMEFCQVLTRFTADVDRLLEVPPSENELAAMVSLAWNIGVGGFTRSSVLRSHNRGDKQSAARAFGLWNKAGGKEIRGLTLRRAREAALYLTPVEDARLPMPQKVEPESSIAKSPIAQGGAVTAAAGAVTAATSAVGSISDQLQEMSINPLMIVGVILVIAGAVIVYNRIKQRREGWS